MAIDLVDYERKGREAVQAFWSNRKSARQNQLSAGGADQGERAGVTAGKNMDGFITLIREVIHANGLPHADILTHRSILTLPGFFRPAKRWDLLVFYEGELIAALELKSHVGPSFGNNFNNRAEEAIGTAHDFWRAYREGALGNQPRPFVGWLMLIEDAPESRMSVKINSPHFPLFESFKEATYLQRYDILCQKLTQEGLYTAASAIASPREAAENGYFSSLSSLTSLKNFISSLAGHVAAKAASLG